jgi:hypothetical protein
VAYRLDFEKELHYEGVRMRAYRKGPVGALMDEYERASADLKLLLSSISEPDFTAVIDAQTQDENCRSVRTIVTHVVQSGYSYADYIREQLSTSRSSPVVGPPRIRTRKPRSMRCSTTPPTH